MPAKASLVPHMDRLCPPAERLQALNTVQLCGGERVGSNTDAPALGRLLEEAGIRDRGALVLGAGGAAAAAALALQELGCEVTVTGRTPRRAEALARRLGCGAAPWSRRAAGARDAAVLVNATPLGADGVTDPLPPGLSGETWRDAVVLDAVLGAGGCGTPLLRRAAAGGARTIDGMQWWRRQGALQLELLTGHAATTEELARLTGPSPLQLRAPGSKSQTQRALILASLAGGESALLHPLDCDDSRHLRRALRVLGAEIDDGDPRRWRVRRGALGRPALGPPALGRPALGRPAGRRELWCGEAGSTTRFLAPLSLLVPDELVLDGAPRLRERPLGQLLGALRALGVEVHRGGGDGLPVTLRPGPGVGSSARAAVQIDASRSSQFASGLLMVGPLLPGGLRLQLAGEAVVSRPYLELTMAAMAAFGAAVRVEGSDGRILRAPAGAYRATAVAIEGDWSAAAFLLAGGLIAGREVVIDNLRADSAQGDRVFAAHLEAVRHAGAGAGAGAGELVFDLTACPDLIAPLAVACALGRPPGGAPARLGGLAHARLKESDRVEVLAAGLARAGIEVRERPDGLSIVPAGAGRLRPAELDPRGDHRMAMAFGLLSLREPGIRVRDPGCVGKSFPAFWRELERLRCA
jgi:3-phosphoshikimate 1-carboxyvinyltransferase